MPSAFWACLCITPDGAVTTKYSLTGDSGYSTLADAVAGSLPGATTPVARMFLSNCNQGREHNWAGNLTAFEVAAGLFSSGCFISDAVTSSGTITQGIMTGLSCLPANTCMTYEASADNGANYEAHTIDSSHDFTNTGTQLKVKAILCTTDGIAAPCLCMVGYQYGA